MKRLALLLLLPVAACTSHVQAIPATGPAVVIDSPSPTPDLKQSAEQFVLDYYHALNVAIRTAYTERLAEMSTNRCPCREVIRIIKATRDHGYISSPAMYTIRSVHIELGPGPTATAQVVYDFDEQKIGRPGHPLVSDTPAVHNGVSLMALVRDGNHWLLTKSARLRS